MWIQRHAITIMFNRTTIFNQNHTCLKVDPISLKVNPLQYLWSQKGERTSMRTMELKCIHQNTLSTCAGKDHCQEMQKQNRKGSVSCLGVSSVGGLVLFCFYYFIFIFLLCLHLQIHTGRVHHSFCSMAFWSFHIRRTPVLYLAYVGIAMCVPKHVMLLWKCL